MTLVDIAQTWSATDLVHAFTCQRLIELEREVTVGLREAPALGAEAAIVFARGQAHERRVLAELATHGDLVQVRAPIGHADYPRAAAETAAAMAAGARAIAGATFTVGEFFGIADVIERVPGHSRFGAWTYEPLDVKLAAHSEPSALIQLCAYADALAQLCGGDMDAMRVHLIGGSGVRETYPVRDLGAIYRLVLRRFQAQRLAPQAASFDRIPACTRCRYTSVCETDRLAVDDLSIVANIRRDTIRVLREAGMTTSAALAGATDAERPASIAATTFSRIRAQAALQCEARASGRDRIVFLPREDGVGFERLPDPSPLDLAFDLEGDPFVPGQLDYLFGLAWREAQAFAFQSIWAHTHAAEEAALAELFARIAERRALDPSMHVYHYAPYERTAMARIALRAGREAELDAFVRDGVFVDLYAVVRGALLASTPTYSIKAIERFYRAKRTEAVASAIGSVVEYEHYLADGDPKRLAAIERYNRDDCFSTLELQAWLLERKREAFATLAPPNRAESVVAVERSEDAELTLLGQRLRVGGAAPALLADLLEYHRREAAPMWRDYFAWCEQSTNDLVDDPTCLGGLELDAAAGFARVDRSTEFALRFPPQRYAIRAEQTVHDPRTRKSAGTVSRIEGSPSAGGRIWLRRGGTIDRETAMPRALVPYDSYSDTAQRDALRRIARADPELAHASVARHLLAGGPPRLHSGGVLRALAPTPETMAATIIDLDHSALVVQGPPGTGKTWIGARAIGELLTAGLRVGIVAGTHKAIHNVLREVEEVATARGLALSGWKKRTTSPESAYVSASGVIVNEAEAKAFPPPADVRLIAGTPSLWARDAMVGSVDVLVVDEAGQLAIADAVAISGAAPRLVLLGDPRQLPHVTTGAHPAGAERSVLAHLLGSAATVADDCGMFLPISYRMHPAICEFISEFMYDGRLTSDPACARQALLGAGRLTGAGLRSIGVAHRGRSNASPEEAERIVALLREAEVGMVRDEHDVERPFVPSRDAIVVAPYNAQVGLLRSTLAAAGFADVAVGTVDKFQGQEAPLVLYSMTTSSDDDLPHDLEFLFDRQRFNVAISRARAMAVVLYSPALLACVPHSVDQLRAINALARVVERSQ